MKQISCMAAFLFTWTLVSVGAPPSSNSKMKQGDHFPSPAEKKPPDRSLAVYFRDLASQERELADACGRIATIYRTAKPPAGLDAASAREFENQYQRFAETEATTAASAAAIAAYHIRMADAAGSASLAAARQRTHGASLRK
jgi:hypothetical protein